MNWRVGLFGAVVFTALAGAAFFAREQNVSFSRLQEAHARLAALGYYCTSDSANGRIGCGFLISKQAVTWNDVSTLCKSGPMGPEWEAKVWVTVNPEIWQLQGIPDQAGLRVWGAVIAFGDDTLLHEVEDALLGSN